MNCETCGYAIPSDSLFCPNCGAAVLPKEAAPVAESIPAVEPTPEAIPEPAANPSYIPFQPSRIQPPPAPMQPPMRPVAPMPMPVPAAPKAKQGKGAGWIVFLRVFLWILFAGIIISALVVAVQWFQYYSYGYDQGLINGILFTVGGILLAFAAVAVGTVALNSASNLRTIATNTARTVELLEELKKK